MVGHQGPVDARGRPSSGVPKPAAKGRYIRQLREPARQRPNAAIFRKFSTVPSLFAKVVRPRELHNSMV